MRVLYDITTLAQIYCAPAAQGAGIVRHTEEMGVAIARALGDDFFVSVAATQYGNAIRYLTETERFGIDRLALPSFGSENVSASALTSRGAGASGERSLERALYRHMAAAYSPERIYNAGQFDVYHVNWRGATTLPDRAHPTVLVTIPDVIVMKHPEWFVPPGAPNPLGEYQATLLRSVRGHYAVSVSTESVKRDVLELFPHIDPGQVHVVPLGVSDRFGPCDDTDLIDATRTRYGIPSGNRYVLCVNTLEPRKNMAAAIDAFAALVGDGAADDLSLVLVGSTGWLSGDLVDRCQQATSRQASIVVTGYVEDADLAPLYAGASLFCYPSLDEGFGLPVLEAMKGGVPVITSNRPPLVEAAGDAALTVDPTDTAGLAEAMRRVLHDRELADDLRATGRARAATYTWDRSAAMMMNVYEQACAHRGDLGMLGAGRRWVSAGGRVMNGGTPKRRRAVPIDARSLDDLAGAFHGERVFILGDGFDPDSEPVALLGDEHTIAINQFHHHYDRIQWKPSFYVAAAGGADHDSALELNAVTGSTFLFDEQLSDLLRAGPDVVPFGFEYGTSRLAEVDLFRDVSAPEIGGPDRSLAAAIQIAYHLGFGPIYLMACEAEGRAAASRAAMRAWHVACRDASEAAGRQIVNLSRDRLFDVYRRSDRYHVFAGDLPEFGRDRHAHVDETEVIATLFDKRDGPTRTMIDVGAHRGTSALHFVGRNWTIHCFEPDQENRDHLTRRHGARANVTIDARAVGAKPAVHVPFFASEESGGISSLVAFRESHTLQGHVDVTTVDQIVDERGITRIDFLKIDVEGFDFDVLKGVPWDRIQPDVIECEYEDAKTLRLGHTLGDVVEYLRARGYVIYVSEWHPIIRYGMAHDWRRVVPYPGFDIPSNSWGNVLAFKHDPGYAAMQEAFAARVTTHADMLLARPAQTKRPTVRSPPVTPSGSAPASTAQPDMPRPDPASTPRGRPFYADAADRLRTRAPGLYTVARLVKRRVGSVWRRHRLALVVSVVAVAALIAAGFAMSGAWRYALWTAAVLAPLAAAILWVAMYSYRVARRQVALDRRLSDLQRWVATESKRSGTRSQSLEGRIERLSRLPQELSTLRRGLERDADRIEELQNRLLEVESNAQLGKTQVDAIAEIRSLTGELEAKVSELHATVGDVNAESLASTLDDWFRYSNYSNAPNVRLQTRLLSNDDIDCIRNDWLRQLGLSLNDRELRYMAHKICLDEDRCEGRMATTIQTAMLRALAVLSIKSDVIELLEIGVLNGISAGSLHRVGARAQRTVRLTLIDPLTGYYEASVIDGQTGVPITLEVLVQNLDVLGVDPSHYRVIQRMSADPEAVAEASDRQYDLVLIDGDHSLRGVSNDFELYGPLVRPGGLLLFDDYDTADWPSITPYVDNHVRQADEWLWIGGQWRTAILQKKMRVTSA